MLGLAIRSENQDLAALVESAGDERHRQVLGVRLIVAAYIAVGVAGRWLADAARGKLRLVSEHETEIPLAGWAGPASRTSANGAQSSPNFAFAPGALCVAGVV
jgi:hypothetical protein